MKRRRVVYADTARSDLRTILHWLSEFATPLSAFSVVEGIEDYIDGLDMAATRGRSREDLGAGLRIVAHHRTTIAITVDEQSVTVVRIFYGGQDWERVLRKETGDNDSKG